VIHVIHMRATDTLLSAGAIVLHPIKLDAAHLRHKRSQMLLLLFHPSTSARHVVSSFQPFHLVAMNKAVPDAPMSPHPSSAGLPQNADKRFSFPPPHSPPPPSSLSLSLSLSLSCSLFLPLPRPSPTFARLHQRSTSCAVRVIPLTAFTEHGIESHSRCLALGVG